MNFNGAQLHLLINHFPVVGIPLVWLTLIWGFQKKQNQVFLFGIYLSILIWISTLISYLTGEGAEDVLRSTEGFNIDFVHQHEDMALIALVLNSVLAIIGLACLPFIQNKFSFLRRPDVESKLRLILVLGFLVLSLIFAVAAHQGGVIRHFEIR